MTSEFSPSDPPASGPLPLAGLTVIEFTHMVMGPVVGSILAELGAEVIKVEPLDGDATRSLKGSGAGYFPMYNRNKQSICLNLKDERGLALARRMVVGSDILVENFRPGTLDGLGLSYESLKALNPRLIYCSQKGFLAGPYAQRTALDEVAQMMGGLAYMTGPPGRPLRAGASVVDVTGGMFGVICILAALQQRHATGLGQKVTSALFETTAFLVGQHMAQMAVTGKAAKPMPVRVSAWAIYDVFDVQGGDAASRGEAACSGEAARSDEAAPAGEQVFVGVVSDAQWQAFCRAFGFEEFGSDERYRTNAQRVEARNEILPVVRARFADMSKTDLLARLEQAGLPFAPIARPEDLFDDPHLNAGGGLAPTTLPDGRSTRLPCLPIEMAGRRPTQGGGLPAPGEHTRRILARFGLSKAEVDGLRTARVIRDERVINDEDES